MLISVPEGTDSSFIQCPSDCPMLMPTNDGKVICVNSSSKNLLSIDNNRYLDCNTAYTSSPGGKMCPNNCPRLTRLQNTNNTFSYECR